MRHEMIVDCVKMCNAAIRNQPNNIVPVEVQTTYQIVSNRVFWITEHIPVIFPVPILEIGMNQSIVSS